MGFLGRSALIAAAILALGLSACNKAGVASATGDMSLGNPQAKVTVVEYASASCPHCAAFNNEIFPAFKANYIDTGRVFYVYREFLTEPTAFAGASYLLARCAGKNNYFKVLDEIFHDQKHIYETKDIVGGLNRAGALVGMNEKAVRACVDDQKAGKALNARVDLYMDRDKITGTPTFLIGDARLEGDQTLAQLDKAIVAAEAKAGKPWRPGRKHR